MFGTDYPTPDGTAVRDYVHVVDLASAHVRALGHLLDRGESLAINLGTGVGISVASLLETAREVTGRAIPVTMAPRREGDPAELVADPRRARTLLGWQATRSSPATILDDAWRWHVKRFADR